MAQDFYSMYPLVDMHGNKGSVDGDSAAAMRYTESKLSKTGESILGEINKKIVDFKPNFCESMDEPTVLPTYFPNILANGTQGIAVGFATNIPPHNANDIYKALYYMLDCISEDKEISEDKIINIIKAPDFPLGGTITDLSKVKSAYKKGRGSIPIRSNHIIEENNIIFTSIPYGTNKSSIVTKIDELCIDGIKEVRDESDSDIRIVIECKKNANKNIILNSILKRTELQKSIPMNLVCIVKNKPVCCTLVEILTAYLEHCIEITINSLKHDIKKDEEKKHLLDGLIICLQDVELTVKIVKESLSDEIVPNLMKYFNITEIQAKNVSDIKLKSINNKNIESVIEEVKSLENNIEKNNKIVNDDKLLCEEIKNRFKPIKDSLPKERKTLLIEADIDISDRDLVEKEEIMISLTNQNLLSASTVDNKESSRTSRGQKLLKLKEDDFIKYMISSYTTDDLLLFTNFGRLYRIEAHTIPIISSTQTGKYLQNFIALEDGEKVVQMLSADPDEKFDLFLVTKNGIAKRTQLPGSSRVTRVISMKEDDKIVSVLKIEKEHTNVMIFKSSGKAIRIDIDCEKSPIRVSGKTAMGVKGINTKDGEVVTSCIVEENKECILVTKNGLSKRISYENCSIKGRGGLGYIVIKLKSDDSLCDAVSIDDTKRLIILTKNGLVKKIRAERIKTIGKTAKGFIVCKLKDGDYIQSISITDIQEDEEETEDEEIIEVEIEEGEE